MTIHEFLKTKFPKVVINAGYADIHIDTIEELADEYAEIKLKEFAKWFNAIAHYYCIEMGDIERFKEETK
jgi:hypothetical protein